MSFTLSSLGVIFSFYDKVSSCQIMGIVDKKIVNLVTVQFYKITDQRWLCKLYSMKKTQIRLKLCIDQSPMNVPWKKLIAKIKEIVYSIISLVCSSAVRSNSIGEKRKNSREIIKTIMMSPNARTDIWIFEIQMLNYKLPY